MTTGKIYFCFIPFHLVYAEINGSLLHFTTDVCMCVCICVCMCKEVRKKEIQFLLWNVKEKKSMFMKCGTWEKIAERSQYIPIIFKQVVDF